MDSTETRLLKIEKAMNVLLKIVNVCQKCNETVMRDAGVAVYPPIYYCPKCDRQDHVSNNDIKTNLDGNIETESNNISSLFS